MNCHHCGYSDQAQPKYCPNCGRINEDDIRWNVTLINESLKRGQATEEDLHFIAEVKKSISQRTPNFSKIDLRSPFEKWSTWIGWVILVIGAGILAFSLVSEGQPSIVGIALLTFSSGLLGVIGMIYGKARYGIRAACMMPILLVGGLLLILSLIWSAIISDPDKGQGPVSDKTSELYNCYRWDKITPSMIGSNVCVYGRILKYSTSSATTDIYFGNKTSDFHFISTNYEFPDAREEQCVKASGEVTSSYGNLVIDISDLSLVIPYSTCDKYP